LANNILKKDVDCTCADFLAEVYVELSKPCGKALQALFTSAIGRGSAIVKEMSMPLRANGTPLESKRAQEMVSRWLGNYDLCARLNPYLLKRGAPEVGPDTGLAVDFSDISKEFGGKGMEGMEMGWDGSRHCTAMGHDFICVSVVGPEVREAVPLYAKLGMGRHAKGRLLDGALSQVMAATGGKGVPVCDRGMDSAEFIWKLKSAGREAVVRVNKMDRDVFGDGSHIDKALGEVPFAKARLMTHRGRVKARLRWRAGSVNYAEEPGKKDGADHEAAVLVVESRFNGKSLYLYAIGPDEVISDPDAARRIAIRAAQLYLDRWQIETSFQTIKQEFSLEKARVRTFRRLANIFALCVLAYVFAASHLRTSVRFGKIVKALGDNIGKLANRTHSLLAGIRALYGEPRIRLITGRPRKRTFGDTPLLPFFESLAT